MPNNLTDDPTVFPSPVQVPAGGDPRTDTSVGTPFQQLANRTANTKVRVDAIAPFSAPGALALPSGVTSGAAALLTASTLTTLASIPIAQRTAGMLCLVLGLGLYQYQATFPIGGAVANTVIAPADTGLSAGAWILIGPGLGLLNAPNCVAQADGTGRTPAAGVRNGLIAYQAPALALSDSYNTGGHAVASSTVTFNGLLVGDIIEARYSAVGNPSGAGDYAQLFTYVNAAGAGNVSMANSFTQSITAAGSSVKSAMGAVATWTVSTPGTHIVQLYGQNGNTGAMSSVVISEPTFVVQVVRP